MKVKKIKAAAMLFILASALMLWITAPSGSVAQDEGESLYPVNDYGWLTYYMHEVWWRYQDARQAFEKGDYELARANLVAMEVFIEQSKDKLPEKLQDGRVFKKSEYLASMKQLTDHSNDVRGALQKKQWPENKEGNDPLLATCVGCHDSYNIPTDFRIDTKFKKLTHYMHEIYELYRQSGIQFMKGESTGEESHYDVARDMFVISRGYIEVLPDNIPEKNQDGEPINNELFKNAYQELKQYNDTMIKKIETKYWKTGKPLPPPRIVVDTCYACHSKVVKIDNPF